MLVCKTPNDHLDRASEVQAQLERLKTLGRDPKDADAIFSNHVSHSKMQVQVLNEGELTYTAWKGFRNFGVFWIFSSDSKHL